METQHQVIAVCVIAALAIWAIDAAVDYLLFCERASWDLLIVHVPPEKLYVRSAAVLCSVLFGVLLGAAMARERRVHQEVQRQSSLLQALLDNIPDSVYFKNREHRFLAASRAKGEDRDKTVAHAVRKTDFDFFPAVGAAVDS